MKLSMFTDMTGVEVGVGGEGSTLIDHGSCLIIPVLSESAAPNRWFLQQRYKPPQMIPGEEGK